MADDAREAADALDHFVAEARDVVGDKGAAREQQRGGAGQHDAQGQLALDRQVGEADHGSAPPSGRRPGTASFCN